MTRGRIPDVFAIGETVGGCEVLEVAGVVPVRYRVRYLCCGTVAVETQEQLRMRERRGSRVCVACRYGPGPEKRRGAPKLYVPGEVAVGVEVLAVQAEAGWSTRYRVRMGCCGAERVMAHRTLEARRWKMPTFCSECRVGRSVGAEDEGEALDVEPTSPPPLLELVLSRPWGSASRLGSVLVCDRSGWVEAAHG